MRTRRELLNEISILTQEKLMYVKEIARLRKDLILKKDKQEYKGCTCGQAAGNCSC